jgi:alkylation response protein AidB-like acyl-CoA dehydrogenase
VAEQTLPTLRRSDYSLGDVELALRDSVSQFFERECPITRVRDADPLAFDAVLWDQVRDLGLLTMALPAGVGDGAGLVALALAAEEQGRRVAPVPLVEGAVALRLLAAAEAGEALHRCIQQARVVTFSSETRGAGPRLVAAGAAADAAVGMVGDELVLVEHREPSALVASIGGAPLGWCDLAVEGERSVLARGARARRLFDHAVLECKVLVAATEIGIARGALDLAVQYAKERFAFGVPIGTFQALSHPLADVLIAIEGGRRLVHRAAWFLDHEPGRARVEVAAAYLHACETGNRAPSVGIHTQGGFGFTLESDLHLYFRRAKSWALVHGDPQAELLAVAAERF